jgi:hypothetical protein
MTEIGCGFSEYKERSPWRSQHVVYYARESSALKLEFVLWYVWPKPTKAAFTLEFGWSLHHRIPEISTGYFALDTADQLTTRFKENEYIQRVGIFFGADIWWPITGHPQDFAAAGDVIRTKILPLFASANR